jgi:hypothetical protein
MAPSLKARRIGRVESLLKFEKAALSAGRATIMQRSKK